MSLKEVVINYHPRYLPPNVTKFTEKIGRGQWKVKVDSSVTIPKTLTEEAKTKFSKKVERKKPVIAPPLAKIPAVVKPHEPSRVQATPVVVKPHAVVSDIKKIIPDAKKSILSNVENTAKLAKLENMRSRFLTKISQIDEMIAKIKNVTA